MLGVEIPGSVETVTSSHRRDRPVHASASDARGRRSRDSWSVGVRLFDLWSEVYDTDWIQRLAYRPVHDAVLDAVRQHPRRAILDLGCGTGLFTRRLHEELRDTRVVGCDFSSGMLRHASHEGIDLAWVRGNAMALPFAEGCFDTVISTEAFHWFPHPRTALGQIRRTLAPGGQLLLAFINPPSPIVSEAARFGSRLFGDPLLWPTPSRVQGWLEEAGFRVEFQRRIRRLPGGIILPPVLTAARRDDS
jgi:ubiquinone/menaquinone biosynthesis C-methylase UbiE